jgi:F0F1-type ATP synthase membrane subunit c/vacuolar-type H+-ATPase subunit K
MDRKKSAGFLASVVIAGFGANFATHAAENAEQHTGTDIKFSAVEESPDLVMGDDCVCEYGGPPDFYDEYISNKENKTYIVPAAISEPSKEAVPESVQEQKTSVSSEKDATNVSPGSSNTSESSNEIKNRDSSRKKKKSSSKKKSKKISINKNPQKKRKYERPIKYGGPSFDRSKLHIKLTKISADDDLQKIEGNKNKQKNSSILSLPLDNTSDINSKKKESVSFQKIDKPSPKKNLKATDSGITAEAILGTGVALGGAAGALYLNSALKRKASLEEEKEDDVHAENEKGTDIKDSPNEKGTDIKDSSNENTNKGNTSGEQPNNQSKPEKSGNKGKPDVDLSDNNGNLKKDEKESDENNTNLWLTVCVAEVAVFIGLLIAICRLRSSSNQSNDISDANAAPIRVENNN